MLLAARRAGAATPSITALAALSLFGPSLFGPSLLGTVPASYAAVLPASANARPGALSWGKPLTIDKQTLSSVSCPTTSFCMATDDIGQAIEYSHGKWGAPREVDGGSVANEVPLGSVSCASPALCEAIVSDGRMGKFNGTKWTFSVQPGYNGYPFNSVSCASSRFCAAVGGPSGNFAIYDGNRWGHAGIADPGGNLASVSCPSTTFCMTVNLNSDQSNPYSASSRTYNGRYWASSVAMPRGFGNGQAVSCLPDKFCGAIDDGGDAAVYNGKSWAHAVTIDPGPLQTVDISCAAKDLCVVVDQKGRALTYNGTGWSRPVVVDPHGLAPGVGAIMAGISCPTTTFCMAVGRGDAVLGK